LSQLLSKVTVTSCSFYIKCSMCPPCCWTTHSSHWWRDQWKAATYTWHFTIRGWWWWWWL